MANIHLINKPDDPLELWNVEVSSPRIMTPLTQAPQSWLSDLEIFALLFSAIIHDFDHSGTTNNFHIQSNSSLAIMYNDKAVLENHHVSSFFRTMIDHECNILNNMSRTEFREFRSLMVEMVLATGEMVLATGDNWRSNNKVKKKKKL